MQTRTQLHTQECSTPSSRSNQHPYTRTRDPANARSDHPESGRYTREFARESLQKSRTRGKPADTRVEDPDLWRFVRDSTVHIGVSPTVVADGRTPFQVFADQRFLGNSRLAP